jgi:hypothetical protein
MIIQFQCKEGMIAEAIDAVSSMMIGKPQLFAAQPLPPSPKKLLEFEELAQRVAKAIKPRANQPMRAETLKLVLGGGDTFWNQKGEADPALRNATGALSKALRPFSMWDSPLDLICSRVREVVAKGPFKGKYQGTRYVPTKLGKRVREILELSGDI